MPFVDNNTKAFLELVRAGLWEKEARLSQYGNVDYGEVMRLAMEQSVVGLVTAGIETNTNRTDGQNINIPQKWSLQFIGSTLQIEQQNQAMNDFLVSLIKWLRGKDVYAVLVKGQGIAQCYEKPLWRTSGDIDLLLSDDNYEAAKAFLTPVVDEVANENKVTKHQAYVIKGFNVELHGKMPFGMSRQVDIVIDEAQRAVFFTGSVRSWMNGNTSVFLPSPDNDVIFVFTHFLHHFFIEGVGLRQICDWCRLLWTYRDSIDRTLLESRIRKAGLMSEWQVFAVLAVNTLGMPVEAMPMLDDSKNENLKKKAEKVLKRVLKSGNFGHNNDLSYRKRYSGTAYKVVAMWRRFLDFASLVPVFPMDAPRFFVTYVFGKVE